MLVVFNARKGQKLAIEINDNVIQQMNNKKVEV